MSDKAILGKGAVLKLSDGGPTTTAPVNARYSLSTTGSVSSGSFQLNFSAPSSIVGPTAAIPWNATPAQVEQALINTPGIQQGDVYVAGGPFPGTPITIDFQRNLGATVVTMTGIGTGLAGSTPALVVTQTIAGVVGTEVFATIAELRAVPMPQRQGARLEVTTHDSPGFLREYVSGLDDIPAAAFQINWLPNHPTHDENTGLLYLQRTKFIRRFKLYLPPGVQPQKVFTFPAQVLQFNPTVPIDNVMQAEVQLQPTAAPSIGSV
jgi:hypothetical protein